MREGLRIYNLFPTLAGSIAEWAAQLPRIAAMGFNAVYINPFHDTGFSGSLYAVKDHYSLHPRFRGDARGSADQLLRAFTMAAQRHGLRVIMDFVVNHTAKDSELTAQRPQWFARDAAGEIRSPFAVDPDDPEKKTVWGDLAELDYRPPQRDEIVAYFAELVHHYIELGFRGFRCDAAYKVPATVWRKLIDAAKARDPDVVFLAENLGASEEEVLALDGAGFDYLFNSLKWWDFESPWLLDQYEKYRHIARSIAFPESHDTERLVTELLAAGFPEDQIEARYRQAYAFSATFSTGVMMPMGFEFGWSRRISVVPNGEEQHPEPARFDLQPFIASVNRMKAAVLALNEEGPQCRLSRPDDPLLVLLRQTESGDDRALVLVNTQEREPRDGVVRGLLSAAGLSRSEEGLVLTDAFAEGEAKPVPARFRVAPLDWRVLHLAPRPVRLVPIAPCPDVGRDAGHRPEWRPEARILIEDVWPEIDAGRYPIKRVVGDQITVWADIFRDGHDKIAAVLKSAFENENWRETPFAFFDNDRWVAHFQPDRVGRWRYTIEAWTDHYESWRADLVKKQEAGQNIAVELVEGERLVEESIRHAKGIDKERLRAITEEFAASDAENRAALMLSDEVRGLMARADHRPDKVCYARELELVVDRVEARFAAWYEMFPRSQGTDSSRSATFDDMIARLDEIAGLGFDVVYLVPIHPIGRINRKGRDNSTVAAPADPGSPYAIGAAEGGHTAVHPDLGTLADFRRFVVAAAERGMEVALDFAIQCAPDHPWVSEHKEWFQYRPDGSIKFAENPPKKYEDIVNVDFYNPDRDGLWRELRDVVLFWTDQGVRTFRVDNPHTKPLPFWEWMIREVKARCPDAVFLSEAFTRPKMMRMLAKAGFTQSYTYFTWRNTKEELIAYLSELTEGPSKEFLRPNFFTNTPDILPVFLQEGGRPAFRIRLALAGTLSPCYGIYNGFELCENAPIPGREEYIHSEKYEYKAWDWDRPGNIKSDIAILNRFRRDNPALHELANLRFLDCPDPNILAYAKVSADRGNIIIAVVNLDPHGVHGGNLALPLHDWGIDPGQEFWLEEAFTGHVSSLRGARQHVVLDPQINPALLYRVLSPNP
jgi:starch synthase (maltosyl-transferring)